MPISPMTSPERSIASTSSLIQDPVNKIITNTALLKRVSNNKKNLGKLDAAERIKEIILNLESKNV